MGSFWHNGGASSGSRAAGDGGKEPGADEAS